MALTAATFIGSSPIRQYTEDWDLDRLLRHTEEAVTFAVSNGLPVMYVTEDTTRAAPDTIRALYTAAIACGARRVCLSDTVGHATPDGVRNLIGWAVDLVRRSGRKDVKIDWHGHNDRGLGLVNSIFALEYGADRVHGTILGIGERVGNAPLDLILVNLRLLGEVDRDLTKLAAIADKVSKATRFPIAINYPVVGEDAFRTATGVHAAAIIKAKDKGDDFLADRVYSGVPAGMFGRHQEICIGPMSGISNVGFWLRSRGLSAEPPMIEAILKVAKQSDHNLSDAEVMAVVERQSRRS